MQGSLGESSPDWLAERQALGWGGQKHSSSKETDIIYPISHFIYEVAKFDKNATEKNGKRIINLSYGEPTKENGYEVASVLPEAVVEVAQDGGKNGYAY